MANKKKHFLPYKSKEYHRSSNLKKLYGITLAEWEELFKEQGERCLICGGEEPRGKNWHTDHCHECGTVRGILCGWCNTAIGKLQEDPATILKALDYITHHNKKGKGREDVLKVIHYAQMLLELEYGEDS